MDVLLRVSRPWLMPMRDVMVDPKRSHANVVRDVMTSYDMVHVRMFVTADLCT